MPAMRSDDDSSVSSEESEGHNPYQDFRRRSSANSKPVVVEFGAGDDDDDDSSVGSFGGNSTDGAESVDKEDLGIEADEFIQKVEKYLADYDPAKDGPIENDPELVELKAALEEAKSSLEKSREAAEEAEKEHQDNVEETNEKITKIKRRNKERSMSIGESSITSKDADDARQAYADSDDEELDRSGHEMAEMRAQFEKQRKRITRKTKKTESLAVEMKMGAKKALRRLKMVNIKARIAKKEEVKRKEEEEKNKVVVDNSEYARRERAYNHYMRNGMPKRADYEKQVKKLPDITAEDIGLLPWDERNLRVMVSAYNKMLMSK